MRIRVTVFLSLVGLLAGCSQTIEATPIVPRMIPGQVSAIAFAELTAMEQQAGAQLRPPRIVSVEALTGLEALEAAGLDPASGDIGIVWRVLAEGTFSTFGGRPGVPAPPSPTGYFVISDADGSILASGYP